MAIASHDDYLDSQGAASLAMLIRGAMLKGAVSMSRCTFDDDSRIANAPWGALRGRFLALGGLLISFALAMPACRSQMVKSCARSADVSQSKAGQSTTPLQQDDPIHSSQLTGEPQLTAVSELVQAGDLVRAESDARTYLSAHADSAAGHFLLGYILYRKHKAKASLEQYTLGAHFRSPSAEDFAAVAMDYVLLNDYADADKWLTRVVAMQPKNHLYWYSLGRVKYTENRFQEAISDFLTSLQLQPVNIRAEYNLGLAYEGELLPEKAKNAYETAIAWQQDAEHKDPQPYLDLGMLLTKQGNVEDSIPLLRQSIAIEPENPKMHEEMGRAYEKLQKLKEAQTELEAAVALAPQVPPLHFELGRIYKKEGLTEQAKAEFARGARLLGDVSTDSAETPNPDVHP